MKPRGRCVCLSFAMPRLLSSLKNTLASFHRPTAHLNILKFASTATEARPTMPGLLGLPPELLENIAQHLLDWDDRAHLASLRLSCRPIEAAIRRSFRLGRFATASISKPTDGNIQEFCAIAQIPDLAKSINHFAIHCADDGSSDYGARNRTQHRDAAHSSNNGHELLWPNGADRLVPTALVSHEEALLAAFLATKNVTELILTDHYWSNSTTEGNEPEHRDLPARRPISRQAERRTLYDFVCDITSTFNLIMSLVAQAGLAPTRITTSSLPGANLVTGLSSAIGLVTYKQALLQLEGLDLVFVDELRDELGTVEAA